MPPENEGTRPRGPEASLLGEAFKGHEVREALFDRPREILTEERPVDVLRVRLDHRIARELGTFRHAGTLLRRRVADRARKAGEGTDRFRRQRSRS